MGGKGQKGNTANLCAATEPTSREKRKTKKSSTA
jgi:hypothetical protein